MKYVLLVVRLVQIPVQPAQNVKMANIYIITNVSWSVQQECSSHQLEYAKSVGLSVSIASNPNSALSVWKASTC